MLELSERAPFDVDYISAVWIAADGLMSSNATQCLERLKNIRERAKISEGAVSVLGYGFL